MLATFGVEVGVALSRPPKHDETVHCLVAVDMQPGPNRWERAETEARLIACQLAASHPLVVMPVSAQLVAVDIETTEAEVGEGIG